MKIGLKKMNPEMIISLFAVFVSVVAMAVTVYQAYIAKDMSQRQLRAYVAVDAPHFGSKNPESVTIKVQNGGQTPAYQLTAHLNRAWFPSGTMMPDSFDYPDYGNQDPQSVATLTQGKEVILTFPNNPDEIKRARAGEINLFYYGHIDYKDTFGNRRVSKFSYQYFPVLVDGNDVGHQLRLLKNYNDAN